MVDPIVEVELRQAIDGLYLAFAGHPLRDWTEPCLDCCATVESEAALHAVPLRELAPEVIGEYGLSAMFTWGDEREFTHLLPRLLEVLVTTGFPAPCDVDVVAVFSGFERASWRAWPPAERSAVERFLMATWIATLCSDAPPNLAIDVLTGIAMTSEDLRPYLTRLRPGLAPTGAAHFLDLAYHLLDPGNRSSGHWPRRLDQFEQAWAWLHAGAQRRWGKVLLDDPDPEIREEAARYLAALAGERT